MTDNFVYEIITLEGRYYTTDNEEAEHAWRQGAKLYCRNEEYYERI